MEGSRHDQIEVLYRHCLHELMKTKTPHPTLPTMIADDTTAEIQPRHPNASLEHYHCINPFYTFSFCITDDSLAYHNIHFSLNIVFQWIAICFMFWGRVLSSNVAVTKEEICISIRIIAKVWNI
jgi:hypothetical protein